ncbi:hypothetical protein MMPV_000100 [Pyropia vietnamensis]
MHDGVPTDGRLATTVAAKRGLSGGPTRTADGPVAAAAGTTGTVAAAAGAASAAAATTAVRGAPPPPVAAPPTDGAGATAAAAALPGGVNGSVGGAANGHASPPQGEAAATHPFDACHPGVGASHHPQPPVANGAATASETTSPHAASSPGRQSQQQQQLVAASGGGAAPPPSSLLVNAAPSSTGGGGSSRKRKHMDDNERSATIARSVRTILECLDDDPDREGLIKTPARFAAALQFFTSGYTDAEPAALVGDAEWDENHTELVLVRDISVFSLCEHHMVPFHGKVHIGYIPNGKVVGLSKLARLATLYARRLQVQERLTTQIADAVTEILSPRGVGVLVEATHMCMVMRGVQKVGTSTVTHCMRGVFRTDPALRKEFISLATR